MVIDLLSYFQPAPVKKVRPPPGQERSYAAQAYSLATSGEDNHVRVSRVACVCLSAA